MSQQEAIAQVNSQRSEEFQDEDKVRKNWLISFFVFLGLSVFFGTFFLLENQQLYNFYNNANSLFIITFSSFMFISIIGYWWLTYFFAYKKNGTKWLMFLLITIPLRELKPFVRGDGYGIINYDLAEWFVLALFLGTKLVFWVNSLKLYKLNSARKRKVELKRC